MDATGKLIVFILPHMVGGGAERVAAQLLNEFYRYGYKCEMILTSAKRREIVNTDLNSEIPLTLLSDYITDRTVTFAERKANLLCKPFELAGKPVPAELAYKSFTAQYGREIEAIRKKLQANPGAKAIAFLQPAIPMTLLASERLPNKVIFSERADPNRLMRHRYGKNFIEKYYVRADYAVFQTGDAKDAYPKAVTTRSEVIPNPIKPGLPLPFDGGIRDKRIVTFCRISKQKNLPLLINAFKLFSENHIGYTLEIIGDTINEEGTQVKADIDKQIERLCLGNSVVFKPFSANVHSEILSASMYVNSSDYEGISNAMLESMAIGMPVVCTDCPIGGAKQTIKSGVNGLLVPIGDVNTMAKAMSRIADDAEFAKKLSFNATKVREELSLENIAKKWMEIL